MVGAGDGLFQVDIDRRRAAVQDAGVRLGSGQIMTYPQPSSPSPGSLPLRDGPQELDELTRFRNDWKQEISLHNRAEATPKASAFAALPLDDLLDGNHYSAEELPQAQDSFVRRLNSKTFVDFKTLMELFPGDNPRPLIWSTHLRRYA